MYVCVDHNYVHIAITYWRGACKNFISWEKADMVHETAAGGTLVTEGTLVRAGKDVTCISRRGGSLVYILPKSMPVGNFPTHHLLLDETQHFNP